MSEPLTLSRQTLNVLEHELRAIKQYLDDPLVQEVMVNNPRTVFVERAGQTLRVDAQITEDGLRSLIVAMSNANEKTLTPLLDARLPGLRVAATLPPVAVHGPALCIRRHATVRFGFDDYLASGAFTPKAIGHDEAGHALEDAGIGEGGLALAEFFKALMAARLNFLVTGSTSSGKTAFLNLLAQHIPARERVVTIEDTAELQLDVENWLAFEANPALGVDVRALVKHALRNRPNRIIVGEGRGAECFDILDAYNTGHPGSTVTFHSNSAAQALPRLENMIRMAPEASNWPLADLRAQIAATFSYIVHCSHVDGIRGPAEVLAIRGCQDGRYQLQSLFQRGGQAPRSPFPFNPKESS